MKRMDAHFSTIAPKYRDVRTTDVEPILHIRRTLKGLKSIKAADIGCGAGRYCRHLFGHLPKGLFLYCVDANSNMLRTLSHFMTANDIRSFRTVQSIAEDVPLDNESLDCVLTFNAIHHFHVGAFLQECSRLLRPGGYTFIYTRLRSQNARNVWGQFFPGFTEKEVRLFEIDELCSVIRSFPSLSLDEIKFFTFSRIASLEDLVDKATHNHYSTFALYAEEEFRTCLEKFKRTVSTMFVDTDQVCWQDENVMLILRHR